LKDIAKENQNMHPEFCAGRKVDQRQKRMECKIDGWFEEMALKTNNVHVIMPLSQLMLPKLRILPKILKRKELNNLKLKMKF
jgi:hypothetical protein